MDNVRLGIIGTGVVFQNYHACNWQHLRNATVAAVCDLRPEVAEAAAQQFGAQVFPDSGALLREADIDALYILLPPFAHGDQELLAVERRIPFFVEKPVTIDLGYAREVARAAEQANLITSVGYHQRYWDMTDKAQERLQGHTLAMLNGYWLGGFVPLEWWGKLSMSGGQIVEQATHTVDLMRYFAGDVSRVHCVQAQRVITGDGVDIPDVGAVLVEFDSGAIGSLLHTSIFPKGHGKIGLQIIADGMTVEVATPLVVRTDMITEEVRPSPDIQMNPYLREDQIFVDAVRRGDGSAIRSTYSDATRSLEVSLAANQAATSGQPVTLPLA